MNMQLKSLILSMLLMAIVGLHTNANSVFARQESLSLANTSESTGVEIDTSTVYEFNMVDQMPSFPGGVKALDKFISSTLVYPEIAKENRIQGRVIVSFVVNKDGSLSYVEIVRAVDSTLGQEAFRIMRHMPRWNPGKLNGTPVRVRYTMPIDFRLP